MSDSITGTGPTAAIQMSTLKEAVIDGPSRGENAAAIEAARDRVYRLAAEQQVNSGGPVDLRNEELANALRAYRALLGEDRCLCSGDEAQRRAAFGKVFVTGIEPRTEWDQELYGPLDGDSDGLVVHDEFVAGTEAIYGMAAPWPVNMAKLADPDSGLPIGFRLRP